MAQATVTSGPIPLTVAALSFISSLRVTFTWPWLCNLGSKATSNPHVTFSALSGAVCSLRHQKLPSTLKNGSILKYIVLWYVYKVPLSRFSFTPRNLKELNSAHPDCKHRNTYPVFHLQQHILLRTAFHVLCDSHKFKRVEQMFVNCF